MVHFKKINFFKLKTNYFTIWWWFLPYIDMNQPRVYMCPPSQSSLSPPSLSYPSGLSQCTGFIALFHASNLDWSSISHGHIHVSMYSLKSSHHRLLPQSPKVCSLCLFCCLAYRVVVTIFLNSIYMR